MKVNELKQLLRASPFHALTLCMASNKTHSIRHPEFAALAPDGRTMVVFLPDGQGLDVLDVPLIERIEVCKRTAARS